MKLSMVIRVPNPENERALLADINIQYEATVQEYVTSLQTTRASFKDVMEIAKENLPQVIGLFKKQETDLETLNITVPAGQINKINAIKTLRELTDLSLAEAKKVADDAFPWTNPSSNPLGLRGGW